MNVTDSGVRVPRKLVTTLAVLAVVAAAAVGLYAALGRTPDESDVAPSITAPQGATVVSAPVTLKPRRGRVLRVGEALRELDLIKPTREKLAEDFLLPLTDGRSFRLAEQRGKVVLVNFWATWCPPCREEMPAMQRLWEHQKDQGFVLVAVSVDVDPKLVKPYLAQHKLSFPVALDSKMQLANAYGVRALPSSFIVDPQGHVAALALGPRPWDGDASRSLVEGLRR